MLQGGPELPPNVQLLTLQALPHGQLLLRLAHLYQVGLGPYNTIFSQSDSWHSCSHTGTMLPAVHLQKNCHTLIEVLHGSNSDEHALVADWRR